MTGKEAQDLAEAVQLIRFMNFIVAFCTLSAVALLGVAGSFFAALFMGEGPSTGMSFDAHDILTNVAGPCLVLSAICSGLSLLSSIFRDANMSRAEAAYDFFIDYYESNERRKSDEAELYHVRSLLRKYERAKRLPLAPGKFGGLIYAITSMATLLFASYGLFYAVIAW